MNLFKKGLLGLAAAAALTAMTTPPAVAQKIAISWSAFQEERWAKDRAAFLSVFEPLGIEIVESDAQNSPERQNADIENLITQQPDFLIVVATDTAQVIPAVQAALDEGIPVLGYDRLIALEGVLYTTFDNVEVGRIQARAVLEQQPTGNYVFIKGNPGDPNAFFVHGGQLEVLQSAIDSGDIKVVGDQFTDNWVPEIAQRNMENILTQANNEVDAVVVSNDGMAGGVVAALTSAGLDGIPVSGQDGDFGALNRVAAGTQTVSVWKDVRVLGTETAEWAAAIVGGTDAASFAGVSDFDVDGGPTVDSILIAPTPITSANLNVVVDAGWIDQATLCQGISGGPAPCN